MSKQSKTLWEIEPHTQAKHEILRRYLGAWFGILGQKIPRIMYLDGFCGPGRYIGGEDGSPIIALKEAIKHTILLKSSEVVFFFIDEDSDRIEHLRHEIALLPVPSNFKLIIETGEFHYILQQVFDLAAQVNSNLVPTFAFIDPFGFKGVPFDLISRLLKNPHTEVFINVMIDFVNRFIDHPDPQTQQHVVDLFGTPQALDIIRSSGDRLATLRRLYLAQLQKHGRFVRYFEMRNDRDRPLYYLFFASNHPLGHARMKEAFWKVDPSSGFKFSDTTDPNQLVLFEVDPSSDLAKLIFSEFNSKIVLVGKIHDYVENETSYTCSQMKKALGQLEERQQLCVCPCKADGKKRRRSTFPDNAFVEFQDSDKN
jgi:three-Cys-motif partner protein